MVDYSDSTVHDGSDEYPLKITAADVCEDVQAALYEHQKPGMLSDVQTVQVGHSFKQYTTTSEACNL